ncbi:MAG: hypothetical protein ABI456_02845 [Ktedonobacteraceae bacterium]|nr:DUF1080 domain-containing protein [Chloroflexota bacterium]
MSEELYQRRDPDAPHIPQPTPPDLPYSEGAYYEHPANWSPPPSVTTSQSGTAQQPFVTAPQSGPARPPRQPHSRGKIILLVVLALVVIAGGTGLFFVIYNQQVAANNVHATATSISGATSTFVSAQGTIDARLHATATGFAQATASVDTANPNPYPPSGGTMALYSPLNNSPADASWSTTPGACEFINGSYHVFSPDGKFLGECGGNAGFSNFTVEVQVTIVQGAAGGVILRSDANGDMYLFEIEVNGAYSLIKYVNHQHTQVLAGDLSPVIHAGLNQMNVIAVVAIGSSFTLYINHQKVAQAHDNISSQGDLELVADPYANRAEAAFNNVKVWTFA